MVSTGYHSESAHIYGPNAEVVSPERALELLVDEGKPIPDALKAIAENLDLLNHIDDPRPEPPDPEKLRQEMEVVLDAMGFGLPPKERALAQENEQQNSGQIQASSPASKINPNAQTPTSAVERRRAGRRPRNQDVVTYALRRIAEDPKLTHAAIIEEWKREKPDHPIHRNKNAADALRKAIDKGTSN